MPLDFCSKCGQKCQVYEDMDEFQRPLGLWSVCCDAELMEEEDINNWLDLARYVEDCQQNLNMRLTLSPLYQAANEFRDDPRFGTPIKIDVPLTGSYLKHVDEMGRQL